MKPSSEFPPEPSPDPEKLQRPQFTPIFSGSHHRLQRFQQWRWIELVLLVIVALFAYWAYQQHKPF